MTGETTKIGSLQNLTRTPESALVPFSILSEEESYKTDVSGLRQTLLFENAFTTLAEGTAATKTDDSFFVYSDDTKNFVLGWMKTVGGAVPILGGDANQVKYSTTTGIKKAVELTGPSGAGKITNAEGVNLQNISNTVYGVNTIAELKKYVPSYQNETVEVKGYNSKNDYGGGLFTYDKNSTAADDGIFTIVTDSGARFIKLTDNRNITLAECGLLLNGTTVETAKLRTAISVVSSKGLFVINGLSATVVVDGTITIDLHKVGLTDLQISYVYPGGVAPTTPTAVVALEGTSGTPSASRRILFSKVRIWGPTSRDTAPVYGFLVKPTSNLANALIEDCQVIQLRYAIVFGTNSYLITFVNFTVSRVHCALVDTTYVGIETAITNAGENVRFIGGVIANSNSALYFTGYEVGMKFYSTSFDYLGGPLSVSYRIFTISKQGVNLKFEDCHFESGNVNDGVTAEFFYCTASVNVTIIGGNFVYGNSTYNNSPYFFYDNTAGKSSFTLTGTRIFGLGFRRWSNIVPKSFYPEVNYDVSEVYSAISDNNRYLIDQNMKVSTIPDLWYAGGTRTSRLESNQLLISQTTVDDGTGTMVTALKVTKKASASNAIVYLVVNRPNNDFGPAARIAFKVSTAATLSSAVNFTLSLFKDFGEKDTYNVPVQVSTLSTWQVGVTAMTETFTDAVIRGSLGRSPTFIGYDKMLLGININALPSGTDFFITNVRIDQPWS